MQPCLWAGERQIGLGHNSLVVEGWHFTHFFLKICVTFRLQDQSLMVERILPSVQGRKRKLPPVNDGEGRVLLLDSAGRLR